MNLSFRFSLNLLAIAALSSGCAGFGISKAETRTETRAFEADGDEVFAAAMRAAEKLGLTIWEKDAAKKCFKASLGPGLLHGSMDTNICLERQETSKTWVRLTDGGLSVGLIAKADPSEWNKKFFDEVGRQLPLPTRR